MIRRQYIAASVAALIVAAVLHGAIAQTPSSAAPVYGYKVVHSYPHDTTAFTEGAVFTSMARSMKVRDSAVTRRSGKCN